jgi:hypothetical protein
VADDHQRVLRRSPLRPVDRGLERAVGEALEVERLPVVAEPCGKIRVQRALQRQVLDTAAHVEQRCSQLSQRLHGALALVGIAGPESGDADIRSAAQLGGEFIDDGQRPDQSRGRELVRGVGDGIAPPRQHALGVIEREGDVECENLGPEFVQTELE